MDSKLNRIKNLELEILEPDFWNDQNKAKKTMAELDDLKNVCRLWYDMSREVKDLIDLSMLATDENDEKLLKDVEDGSKKLEKELSVFEVRTKLGGEHDKNNAIISIHAGAGGTESCDWAQILLRMYSRWAEDKGFKTEVVDSLDGDEAGIKNITMIIRGEYAYGFLQSEIGVHRLVRISPFDSNKRRHTSFSSVDVIPEVEDSIDIIIEDKDIRIDTYRASGAGGQHINKTDSAVRITHLATEITVQSQNDRSQIKNRTTAMKLLKARLYELEQEKQRASYEKHYNEKGAIEWSSQIRSYVFMPYQLVKDHRTGYKTLRMDLVMDGDIDDFISAYLSWKLEKKK
ncbi:peptide chain release factor 2 [Candidatus Endomicrobiellum trichonymphae]|uniref:peptide chain release factor 2 n=1 Tax=Endomicrobium trichonymphae TaxID=1408204 RepID=UPI0018E0B1F5|nr:peptide chain release factor 2 [Candidatus Endomicrobium trichonymphae]